MTNNQMVTVPKVIKYSTRKGIGNVKLHTVTSMHKDYIKILTGKETLNDAQLEALDGLGFMTREV